MTAAYFYVTDGGKNTVDLLRYSVLSLRNHVDDPLIFVCITGVEDPSWIPSGCVVVKYDHDVFKKYNGGASLEKRDDSAFPLACFLRFVAPLDDRVISECKRRGCDRLVYLDCDTEVLSSGFRNIADENLCECSVGGCRDPWDRNHIRLVTRELAGEDISSRAGVTYVNSGVLLFDISSPHKWNNNAASAVLAAYVRYGDRGLTCPDQDCLWLASGVSIAELPPKYNHLMSAPRFLKDGTDDVYLLHYTGPLGRNKKIMLERAKKQRDQPPDAPVVQTDKQTLSRIVVTLIGCVEDLDEDPETKRNLERMNAVIRPDRPAVLFVDSSSARSDRVKKYVDILKSRRNCTVISIPDGFTDTYRHYQEFSLTPVMYEVLRKLGFTHRFNHEPDLWVNRDDLDWWALHDYDYVASPLFRLWENIGSGRPLEDAVFNPLCGGGSFCRVAPIGDLMREYQAKRKTRKSNEEFSNIHDDMVICGTANIDHEAESLPRMKIAPRDMCLKYGWNDVDPEVRDPLRHTETLGAFSQTVSPMVIHKPKGALNKELTRRATHENPKCVMLVSSAMPESADPGELIPDGVDPEDVLPVFMNHCKGLTDNPFGRILVQRCKRLMTIHNFTIEPPFGFCDCEKTANYVRDVFGGLLWYDRELLHYSTKGGPRCFVTYDGVVRDDEATRSLLSIHGEDNGKHVPTAGFMAYRILRDRYPDARFVLVDFFGRDGGHFVWKGHDTKWEQAEYAKDTRVERVFTR